MKFGVWVVGVDVITYEQENGAEEWAKVLLIHRKWWTEAKVESDLSIMPKVALVQLNLGQERGIIFFIYSHEAYAYTPHIQRRPTIHAIFIAWHVSTWYMYPDFSTLL